MTKIAALLSILLVCVLECSAQQKDSLSDGFSVVAPGGKNGQGTLADTLLENVDVSGFGIGARDRHGLWVRDDASGGLTIARSRIADVSNSSTKFHIQNK